MRILSGFAPQLCLPCALLLKRLHLFSSRYTAQQTLIRGCHFLCSLSLEGVLISSPPIAAALFKHEPALSARTHAQLLLPDEHLHPVLHFFLIHVFTSFAMSSEPAACLGMRLHSVSKQFVAQLLPLTTHKRHTVRIAALQAIRVIMHQVCCVYFV